MRPCLVGFKQREKPSGVRIHESNQPHKYALHQHKSAASEKTSAAAAAATAAEPNHGAQSLYQRFVTAASVVDVSLQHRRSELSGEQWQRW